MYDKIQATEEFNRWSEGYDRCILQWMLFDPTHQSMLARLETRYGGREARFLDVGCGTGKFIDRIRSALPRAQVWGVDLVGPMLRQGMRRWERHQGSVQPIQADSERLPFDDDQFDAITCAHSFHHYPNQAQAVAEMYRVLRPGGRLILVDGHRDWIWGWFIYDVCVAFREGAVHHCSARRFRDLARDAGFETAEQKVHWGLAPYIVTEAQKPLTTPILRFDGRSRRAVA